MHLRNFGILMPETTPDTLAPIYDFVSTIPYMEGFLALPLLALEESETELAPGFNTEFGCYTGYDFLLLADAIGISNKMAEKLLDDVVRKKSGIAIEIIQDSYMPNDQKTKVVSCINFRTKALKERIFNPL